MYSASLLQVIKVASKNRCQPFKKTPQLGKSATADRLKMHQSQLSSTSKSSRPYCLMIKNSTLILLFMSTGSPEFDQIISVLLKTSMAVGGIVAIILDNTIPGTDEERGLMAWRQSVSDENGEQFQTASIKIYDLPFGLNRLSNYKFAKYLPFLPNSDDKNEINENVELKEKNAGGLGRVASRN